MKEGDIGAIVHIHADGETIEVEFVTAEGKTVAVLTLKPENIRSIADREILHVRGYRLHLAKRIPKQSRVPTYSQRMSLGRFSNLSEPDHSHMIYG